MRDVEQILGWVVGLIVLFLLLSRAAETNAIINTLGGFFQSETSTLQGYSPSGQLLSSQATNALQNTGYRSPVGSTYGPAALSGFGLP